jgi:hypothetical protein
VHSIRWLSSLSNPVQNPLLLEESILRVRVMASQNLYVPMPWSLGFLLKDYPKLGLIALTITVETDDEHKGKCLVK